MKKVYAYVCGSSVSIMGIDPVCVCKFIAIRASGVIFFQRTLAFGKKVTFALVGFILTFQMALTLFEQYWPSANHLFTNITRSGCYVIFIFTVLKEHIGKLVFTVLALSNLSDFAVFGGRCLEASFFPDYPQLENHFTFSLFMLLVLAAELPLIYLLVFRNICTRGEATESEDQKKIGDFIWRYLWLVPAVFYLISMQYFYEASPSGQRDTTDPVNTLYLFFVDAGSVLIYRIIILTAELYKKNSFEYLIKPVYLHMHGWRIPESKTKHSSGIITALNGDTLAHVCHAVSPP